MRSLSNCPLLLQWATIVIGSQFFEVPANGCVGGRSACVVWRVRVRASRPCSTPATEYLVPKPSALLLQCRKHSLLTKKGWKYWVPLSRPERTHSVVEVELATSIFVSTVKTGQQKHVSSFHSDRIRIVDHTDD